MARGSATKYCVLGAKNARNAILFLHGWKMSGANMRSSVKGALGGGLPDTIFYFLTSSATRNDDGEEPEWFAYRSDDKLNFVASDLLRTRQRLIRMVERLRTRHRRRGGTVSISGYSQGACMAIDVALSMELPMKVLLFSGFVMLPRFVSADGWHGYKPSSAPSRARLKLSILHGRQDTEIGWGLARRSYDALRESQPDRIDLERVIVTENDHWVTTQTRGGSNARAAIGSDAPASQPAAVLTCGLCERSPCGTRKRLQLLASFVPLSVSRPSVRRRSTTTTTSGHRVCAAGGSWTSACKQLPWRLAMMRNRGGITTSVEYRGRR